MGISSLEKLVEFLIFPPLRLPSKSITNYLPFNYRLIPESLRTFLLQFLSRNVKIQIDNQIANHPFEYLWESISTEQKKKLYEKYGLKDYPEKTIILTHDIEGMSKVEIQNMEKVASIENDYGFTSVWNIIGFEYQWDESLLSSLKSQGHEIGLHGFFHDNRDHQRSEIKIERLYNSIQKKIQKFSIVGGRMPSWLVDQYSLRIFSKFFKYDLSMQDETVNKNFPVSGAGIIRPYRIGSIVEIPTNINFGKLFVYQTGIKDIPEYWTKKSEEISRRKGVVVCMNHPSKGHLFGKERLKMYSIFLGNLKSLGFKSCLPLNLIDKLNEQ